MIPTVFINAKLQMIIHWRITSDAGFQDELIPEYASGELIEVYHDVLTVMRDFYDDCFSFGLELEAESFQEIAKRRLYLSGDSVGAAWLLGALCHFFSRPFPEKVLTWGALRPIRNGGFALFKTAGTYIKTKIAMKSDCSKIIVHKDEVMPRFNGETVRLSGDLEQDLKKLETLIHGRQEN